jgi:hypothetical protein
MKKRPASEASPASALGEKREPLLNRVQSAEEPVRLVVDASGKEERVRGTGGYAIAEGNRPESVNGQY